jgi:hypothetical protein
MKFRITLKDPDGVGESLDHEVHRLLPDDLDDEEREVVSEVRLAKLEKFIEPWVEYGEYITIEFDTEAGTATVQKTKEEEED